VILLDIILKGLTMNDVTFQVPVQSSLLVDEPFKEFSGTACCKACGHRRIPSSKAIEAILPPTAKFSSVRYPRISVELPCRCPCPFFNVSCQKVWALLAEIERNSSDADQVKSPSISHSL
jgi:hypothetical protein